MAITISNRYTPGTPITGGEVTITIGGYKFVQQAEDPAVMWPSPNSAAQIASGGMQFNGVIKAKQFYVSPEIGSSRGLYTGGVNPSPIPAPYPSLGTGIRQMYYMFANDSDINTPNVLSTAVKNAAGVHSDTHGYVCGGLNANPSDPAFGTIVSDVQKFQFANDSQADNIDDLTYARWGLAGASSNDKGLTIGGGNAIPTPSTPVYSTGAVTSIPWATDTCQAHGSSLTNPVLAGVGLAQDWRAYVLAGSSPTLIYGGDGGQWISFTNHAIKGSTGTLYSAKWASSAQTSEYGYMFGGHYADPTWINPSPVQPGNPICWDNIERFPFASETTNAVLVGDLSTSRAQAGHSSSATHGYIAAGVVTGYPTVNIAYNTGKEKFQFSADAIITAEPAGGMAYTQGSVASNTD